MKNQEKTTKISIAAEFKKKLTKEFGVSRQTIHYALVYSNNSALAKQIRLRARELLLAEAKKIKPWMLWNER